MKKIIVAIAFLGISTGGIASAFAGYFNTAPMVRCDTQITNTLQAGSENSDVYTLQKMLLDGGYLHVNPNGYFGPSTILAVKRFQGDNGISATGIVGESTKDAVNERLCDTNVSSDTNVTSYGYGYGGGVTYVDKNDPYARVITPSSSNLPVIYTTPQGGSVSGISYNDTTAYPQVSGYSSNNISAIPGYSSSMNVPITPATTGGARSTGIIYSSNLGYLYGVTPNPSSVTITSPLANSLYNEGDTVNIVWSTNNLNASGFQVFLENTSTGQSKQVSYVTGNSASFVLSKALLDSVCAGTCDNSQQGTFRFVIATPVTDITGSTSNFRAMISPVTIRRPYSLLAAININPSKTPVNTGEGFRMYVNTPGVNTNLLGSSFYGNAVIKLHALCVNSNVSVNIAGVACGQDFTMPLSTLASQQGIPVVITNTTWFTQDVVFEGSIVNQNGQIMGTSQTKVTVSPASFNW